MSSFLHPWRHIPLRKAGLAGRGCPGRPGARESRLELMRALPVVVAAVLAAAAMHAQEREVPRDSERISIPGCAKGRTFIVATAPEHEPVRSDIPPGRRFRLSGSKQLLEEIRKREGTMIEVTGLIRKADLAGPGGIPIAGGRVRIGGRVPQDPIASPGRDPGYNQAVLDLEAWRQLPESCPNR